MAMTSYNTALAHRRVRSLVTSDAFGREVNSCDNPARLSLRLVLTIAPLKPFGFVNARTLGEIYQVRGEMMRWSKMKVQIESRLCDSLKARVTFNSTRYRGSHDQEGRAWITLDDVIVHDFSTDNLRYKYETLADEFRKETNALDWKDPAQQKEYYAANSKAVEEMKTRGIHNQYEFYNAIEEYLNLSIEEAMNSTNTIIRAISWWDKRLGKRRLINKEEDLNILVRKFKKIRLRSEGLLDEEGKLA